MKVPTTYCVGGAMRNMTVTIKVTGVDRLIVRLWLGRQLIRLGLAVAGVGHVVWDEEP